MQPPFDFDKQQVNPLILAIIFFIGVIGFSSYVIVDAGHVGVVKRLGAVQDRALSEGFHLKLPILDKIVPMDIRLVKVRSTAQSASKDLQTVTTVVTVQASINGYLAPQIFQRIGRLDDVKLAVVEPAIQESVKAIMAQYTAEQLVTQRADVKLKIQKAIQSFIDTTLKQKEITNGLYIANVAITDFNFSSEFNRAIELKVKAEQEALQAENEKIRRVTQAEAAAQEMQLAADAQAYETEVISKARADAIRREASALRNNPELIRLRMAEKWNGQLPKFSGSNAVPFINMDLDGTVKR